MTIDKPSEDSNPFPGVLKSVIRDAVDLQQPTLKFPRFTGKPRIENKDGCWMPYQTDPVFLAHLKEQKEEYALDVWGCPEDGPEKFNGTYWFDTADELWLYKEKLSALQTGASSASFGRAVRAKTLVEATMKLPTGEEYVVHEEIGYAYPPDVARYMYVDGNYGCDCNRSIKLRRMGVDIPEHDCGEVIATTKVRVFLDWGDGKKFEVQGLEKGDIYPGEVG